MVRGRPEQQKWTKPSTSPCICRQTACAVILLAANTSLESVLIRQEKLGMMFTHCINTRGESTSGRDNG
eukprot:m.29219 g.29219  ORF g.29219 m.29219 type:complete len:69 (-) comp6656_c0_seq2:58-264(-)